MTRVEWNKFYSAKTPLRTSPEFAAKQKLIEDHCAAIGKALGEYTAKIIDDCYREAEKEKP